MAAANNLTAKPVNRSSLRNRMLIGAGIAFMLMFLLLWPFDYARPEWGAYWFIRPFVVITFAGAVGGACNYFLFHWTSEGGWKRIMATLGSVVIYIFGLWVGTILGLDGTLWD